MSLKTGDKGVAVRRAKEFVERKIRALALRSDPIARSASSPISQVLGEYLDDLVAEGNTLKQKKLVDTRINAVINQAGYQSYAEVDPVTVRAAIAGLQESGAIKTTTTANKYVEAMRAWSRWVFKNGRWKTNSLDALPKFKGDATPKRRRAILTDDQLAQLFKTTKAGPMRQNLFGEERAWLYLIAAQTGLRASELDSLTPSSFCLRGQRPHITVHCTVSKRRTTDEVDLSTEFATLLAGWLQNKPNGERLWGRSRSWTGRAAAILRKDLKAAGLPTQVTVEGQVAEIDFHALRCYRVTKALLTGAPSQVVLKAVRLSTEALLQRYQKIPEAAVRDCVNKIPLPPLNDLGA